MPLLLLLPMMVKRNPSAGLNAVSVQTMFKDDDRSILLDHRDLADDALLVLRRILVDYGMPSVGPRACLFVHSFVPT